MYSRWEAVAKANAVIALFSHRGSHLTDVSTVLPSAHLIDPCLYLERAGTGRVLGPCAHLTVQDLGS